MITYDEIVNSIKSAAPKIVSTISISTNFCISFEFLLIAVALLIAVSIYLIRHQLKFVYCHIMTPANQKKFTLKIYYKK